MPSQRDAPLPPHRYVDVRLIAEYGTAQKLRTGEAFLIPNGFRGYWDVVETTTRHFVIRNYAA